MPVGRLTDRIEGQVRTILEERAAPDDTVEWDLAVVPVDEVCGEDDDDTWHAHRRSMLSFYVTLDCPEVDAKSVAHIMVPTYLCEVEQVDEWVNDVWDGLVLNRMNTSNALHEYDLDLGGADEG